MIASPCLLYFCKLGIRCSITLLTRTLHRTMPSLPSVFQLNWMWRHWSLPPSVAQRNRIMIYIDNRRFAEAGGFLRGSQTRIVVRGWTSLHSSSTHVLQLWFEDPSRLAESHTSILKVHPQLWGAQVSCKPPRLIPSPFQSTRAEQNFTIYTDVFLSYFYCDKKPLKIADFRKALKSRTRKRYNRF